MFTINIHSTHLTYKEIGTNVLRTMAYEKNTKVPMVIDPAILSDGTSESQGKYVWKYQPVLNSQKTDPIIQDRQSKKRNNTICGKATKTNNIKLYNRTINKVYHIIYLRIIFSVHVI